MNLTDQRWPELRGGYKTPCDPRPVLRRIEMDLDQRTAWDELWNELHHQGDIGEASYAAVIVLADIFHERRSPSWKLFSLAATIEVERHRRTNPPLPEWLAIDYARAWKQLVGLAVTALQSDSDAYTVQSALAILALARKAYKLGALINWLDDSELDALANDTLGWRDLYSDAGERVVGPERQKQG